MRLSKTPKHRRKRNYAKKIVWEGVCRGLSEALRFDLEKCGREMEEWNCGIEGKGRRKKTLDVCENFLWL